MTTKVFPPFRLDAIHECLWRSTKDGAEERIVLKPKTYAILAYFLDHPDRVVTQEELLESIWPDTFVQPEVVKRHIFDLRQALGDDSKMPSFLETLPRRGYKFIAPVQEVERTSRTSPGVKLVGRQHALSELEACLNRAMGGVRQIALASLQTLHLHVGAERGLFSRHQIAGIARRDSDGGGCTRHRQFGVA